MRLLFLSNFYPPVDLGGWEQWCQEIADEFKRRRHDVIVLTSRFRRDEVRTVDPHVHRELYLENDLDHYQPLDFLLHSSSRDHFNHIYLKNLIADYQPQMALIWGMWQLDPTLAAMMEQILDGRVAYYLCGYWPIEPDIHTAYWSDQNATQTWGRLLKSIAGPVALRRLRQARAQRPRFDHVTCVSQAVLDILRSGGLPLASARVLYGGIDLTAFQPPSQERTFRPPLKLLYAGSITPAKGVDTVINAMAILAERFAPDVFHCSVIGALNNDFARNLQKTVHEHRLETYVTFYGWIQKDQMPEIMQEHDVLLFPSSYQEPLARMTMQGMASGMVLVSTTTGGSKEFLVDGQNSLTFTAGDAQGLAGQIERLFHDPVLCCHLSNGGYRTAHEQFNFARMADELESVTAEVASA